MKTGHKAVKSQTSLVSLLMRQVVMLRAVLLAAHSDPVQPCSLPCDGAATLGRQLL